MIDSIRRLLAVASAGVPPTNCTIAGDAAIAKPPRPFGLGDGRIAEVGRGILDGVAGEVEAVDRVGAAPGTTGRRCRSGGCRN